MAWNVEQNILLKRMWRAGHTTQEIADALVENFNEHKSLSAVKSQAKLLARSGVLERRERNWHYKK